MQQVLESVGRNQQIQKLLLETQRDQHTLSTNLPSVDLTTAEGVEQARIDLYDAILRKEIGVREGQAMMEMLTTIGDRQVAADIERLQRLAQDMKSKRLSAFAGANVIDHVLPHAPNGGDVEDAEFDPLEDPPEAGVSACIVTGAPQRAPAWYDEGNKSDNPDGKTLAKIVKHQPEEL